MCGHFKHWVLGVEAVWDGWGRSFGMVEADVITLGWVRQGSSLWVG